MGWDYAGRASSCREKIMGRFLDWSHVLSCKGWDNVGENKGDVEEWQGHLWTKSSDVDFQMLGLHPTGCPLSGHRNKNEPSTLVYCSARALAASTDKLACAIQVLKALEADVLCPEKSLFKMAFAADAVIKAIMSIKPRPCGAWQQVNPWNLPFAVQWQCRAVPEVQLNLQKALREVEHIRDMVCTAAVLRSLLTSKGRFLAMSLGSARSPHALPKLANNASASVLSADCSSKDEKEEASHRDSAPLEHETSPEVTLETTVQAAQHEPVFAEPCEWDEESVSQVSDSNGSLASWICLDLPNASSNNVLFASSGARGRCFLPETLFPSANQSYVPAESIEGARIVAADGETILQVKYAKTHPFCHWLLLELVTERASIIVTPSARIMALPSQARTSQSPVAVLAETLSPGDQICCTLGPQKVTHIQPHTLWTEVVEIEFYPDNEVEAFIPPKQKILTKGRAQLQDVTEQSSTQSTPAMFVILETSRDPKSLRTALWEAKELEETRRALAFAGFSIELPCGAKIFVSPSQYQTAVSELNARDIKLKPKHVIVAPEYESLVTRVISGLPSKERVRIQSRRPFRAILSEEVPVVIKRGFIHVEAPHSLSSSSSSSRAQSDTALISCDKDLSKSSEPVY